MKTLGYKNAHVLQNFSLQEFEVPLPTLDNQDVLVRIKAISINPIDYKIRQNRSSQNDRPVVLGWDTAGVIEKVGSGVSDFKVGDEVFYAGDLMKDGGYAELQVVDHRIIAKKPKSVTFSQAAALPLTSLTAWEALFERGFQFSPKTKVLIIGGAGGVGSIATQLLKAKTPGVVIATASRPDSIEWSKKMGADHVIDHSKNLVDELRNIDIKEVDIVFCTTHSDQYLKVIPEILRPFGHFCLIEDPGTLDISHFKTKALSVHWELMFAKTLNNYALESQGEILTEVATLVDSGKLKPTDNLTLKGFSIQNIRKAHELLEAGKSIGKIVIDFAQ